ncbi:MAG: NUDIX domain-containing protein [Candidatus Tagabacteria bacterium]
MENKMGNGTICCLKKGNQILLAWKTKKLCKDKWNGYGGGIESGEKPRIAAIRELKEETGEKEPGDNRGVIALPEDLEKIAEVFFHNTTDDGSTFIVHCHIYFVHKWTGEIEETDAMVKPTWFDVDNLPYKEMPPADIDYLPYALKGKKLIAQAYLGPFQQIKLKPTEIEFVDGFEDD